MAHCRRLPISPATDPALANATIMRSYHALRNVFGRLLHGAGKVPENVNLHHLRRVGGSQPPSRSGARRRWRFSPASLLRPAGSAYHWVARDVLGVDRAISRNIARGQGAIFEDIGSAVYKLLRGAVFYAFFQSSIPTPRCASVNGVRSGTGYTLLLKETPVYLEPAKQRRRGLDSADLAVLERAVLPYFEVLMEGLSAPDVDDGARKRRAEPIFSPTSGSSPTSRSDYRHSSSATWPTFPMRCATWSSTVSCIGTGGMSERSGTRSRSHTVPPRCGRSLRDLGDAELVFHGPRDRGGAVRS